MSSRPNALFWPSRAAAYMGCTWNHKGKHTQFFLITQRHCLPGGFHILELMVGYILSKHNAAKSGAVILFLISKVLQMEARGNGMVACWTTRWRYVWTKKVFIPVPKGRFSFLAYVCTFSVSSVSCFCVCVCALISLSCLCVYVCVYVLLFLCPVCVCVLAHTYMYTSSKQRLSLNLEIANAS